MAAPVGSTQREGCIEGISQVFAPRTLVVCAIALTALIALGVMISAWAGASTTAMGRVEHLLHSPSYSLVLPIALGACALSVAIVPLLPKHEAVAPPPAVISSPFAARCVAVNVKVGDLVAKNDVICVMEALKMQHSIRAPHAGVITQLAATPGADFSENAPLFHLTPSTQA